MAGIEERFYKRFHAGSSVLIPLVGDALLGADDGELYAEHTEGEVITLKDGKIEDPLFGITEGFGLRRVEGSRIGYVSSGILSGTELHQKGRELRETFPQKGRYPVLPERSCAPLYSQRTPLTKDIAERIALLHEIEAYIRGKEPRVRSVSVNISGQKKEVLIVRPDGFVISELRPLVKMAITVVIDDAAGEGFGGRYSYSVPFDPKVWKKHADRAIRMAVLRSDAKPCPAGQMDVILTNGWAGVLIHEAFGHMLEGDFIWKGVSGFTGKIGKQIASTVVNVVDQGDIPEKRGSLSFDDEGTATQRNVLVRDGILVGYMHDRLSARMLGVAPTGNGRRQDYSNIPLPRMTNTFIDSGAYSPRDIIAATNSGIFVESLGGGQVDITSGQFVFRVDLAWRIKNGKLVEPVKGATLVGSGPKALLSVDMVGNDLALDNGTGTCGKDGQGVPVGVGQPTIRIRSGGLTVGGTEVA